MAATLNRAPQGAPPSEPEESPDLRRVEGPAADEELAALTKADVLNRASATIGSLYEEEAGRIRRYLARLVGPQDAEDLSQEVFARAYRGVAGHRGEARLTTWLFRIATNAAIDHLRRPSPPIVSPGQPSDEEPDAPGAAAAAAVSGSCGELAVDAEAGLMRSETRRCITQLVSTLPASTAAVVALAEFQDLKDREVANALGVSLETVKIRLHRARRRLRTLMLERCELYRDDRGELACDRKRHAR